MPISNRAYFLCLFSVMGLLLSCKHTSKAPEEATEVKTPVSVIPVSYKPISSSITLPAVATFLNKSIIRASTSGNIEQILISPGQFIAGGDLLFSLKTREAMAMSKNSPEDTSLTFKGLVNITSRKEGIINTIAYQKGDFVQEGDELATVSDPNSLVFILDVPFELEKYIDKNKNCRILLPDSSSINAVITHKMPEMDMTSQTVRYVVKPTSTSSANRIPGNLIGSINIVKSTKEKALILPKQAVLGDETQTEFWVMKLVNDSTAVKINVTKGNENNEEVEITNPEFIPSDRIVLTGNYGLPDTARITIIK